MMKIAIVIPAHNEALAIGLLVLAVKTLGYDCIVIDDGSHDQTAEIAQKAQAIVLKTEAKSGKGNALKLGFNYVLDKDYEAIIAMDGDGQHSPSDIEAFVACCENTNEIEHFLLSKWNYYIKSLVEKEKKQFHSFYEVH